MSVPAAFAITEYRTTFSEDGTPSLHITVTFTVATEPPSMSAITETYTGLDLAALTAASVSTIRAASAPADDIAAAILFSTAFIGAVTTRLIADGRIPPSI